MVKEYPCCDHCRKDDNGDCAFVQSSGKHYDYCAFCQSGRRKSTRGETTSQDAA